MTNVRFYGEKPYKTAVVHGGPGAPGSVAAIARRLSTDMGVIEPLQTKTTIEDLLNELDDVIRTSCMVPITIIGHSWGAWLTILYAANYPEIVKKIILVGSGPFEKKYVDRIDKTRRKHLTGTEGKEYHCLLKKLGSGDTAVKNRLLKKLGDLVAKTDNYYTFNIPTGESDLIQADGELYGLIWNEAVAMRESGELLEQASRITCPVVAIHGDYDPHPADGVWLPLEGRLPDFTFYLLEKCGHSPWKERCVADRFYEILKEEITDAN